MTIFCIHNFTDLRNKKLKIDATIYATSSGKRIWVVTTRKAAATSRFRAPIEDHPNWVIFRSVLNHPLYGTSETAESVEISSPGSLTACISLESVKFSFRYRCLQFGFDNSRGKQSICYLGMERVWVNENFPSIGVCWWIVPILIFYGFDGFNDSWLSVNFERYFKNFQPMNCDRILHSLML